ncbi:hypothetical protein H6F93_12030 [Leptolyngbya sp. FACHB-671]|uniref:hypothetical protein n=1 Tax=Leptolyngbya sp. FACHB-671 TaxID=2692812 RepID=UPI00168452A5|nr:hypothetical protein [Leptolyngbya sp. FACHB-671]MBD2068240.1 hypothetical protein [Leptolyngbya sp. FACHB-671]
MNLSFLTLYSTILLEICSGILFYSFNITTVEQTIPIDATSLRLMLELQNQEGLEKHSMSSSYVKSVMSDEVLGRLQELLLEAVLLGQELPGFDQSVQFPDLSFLLEESIVTLIDENLANSISFEEISIPVRILSQEALLEEGYEKGNVAYLRFQPPEIEDNAVRLTLEAKIYSHDSSQFALGLSGIQVTFQRISGDWQVVNEPILFSN